MDHAHTLAEMVAALANLHPSHRPHYEALAAADRTTEAPDAAHRLRMAETTARRRRARARAGG